MARRGAEKPKQPNALVAAATRITLDNPRLAQRQAARRQEWQAEAWAYFDEVPEIKEAVRYRGNQVAKVRLYVAVADPENPDGEPIPASDEASPVPPAVAAAADAELARLRSSLGGQAEIQRMLDMNLEVAGEAYLVGFGARSEQVKQSDGTVQAVDRPEDWVIKSVSEIDVHDGVYSIRANPNDTQGRKLDPLLDTIMRIWCRHPQWGNMADSAMRGLLGECKTLQVLTQQVLAQANSHQSAGAFTLPNELSFGPADPTAPDDADGPAADPFMAEMQRAVTEPIADPSSAASVMPMLIRGPAEFLQPQYLRHISFARDMATELEPRITARIDRIARGLNLPVEKVMGLARTTFANAAQVDEDEYTDYLAPSVDVATDALTHAFLRPQLEVNPAVPAEWVPLLFVAADPSGLISEPDTEANADEAHDRWTISDEAYRRAKGYSEDDAPDPDELLRRAGIRRGIMTANLTKALLELLGIPIDVEALPTAPPAEGEGEGAGPDGDARARLLQLLSGDPPARPTVLARSTVASVPARPDYGRRLADIDRELRTRLLVAANDSMGRALDRAGARLRSKTNGTPLAANVRGVDTRLVFAHLGATLVAQALGDDDVLVGAWDDLEEQFMAWGAQAQSEAIDVAGRVVSGFSASERSTLQLRQAEDLGEAWVWMREALDTLAAARMYDPHPAVPDDGEFDPTLRVPTGLVRQAIARAGGATGLTTEEGGAWLALTDSGTRPAGGIGTGELVRGALRDGGASVEAYMWVYGAAQRARPFEEHLRLDGKVFRNFDDEVLANDSDFPDGAFYLPGDHSGCSCDFEPVIVSADEVDDVDLVGLLV